MTTVFLLRFLFIKNKSKMGKFPVYEPVNINLNLIIDIYTFDMAVTSYMWLLKTNCD